MITILMNAKGTLLCGGKYHLICGRCGCLTTESQAAYSVKELGHVECIECQRLFKKTGRGYPTPEKQLENIPLAKRPCSCGKPMSKKQVLVSYTVTNDSRGKNGQAMCKKCLVTKYGCHIDHVLPDSVVIELQEGVPAFEPEFVEG